ncbi:V-type immunoglobulin domain-containing suppressor of T-cell activation isoform X2 [Latimeria chalumnae]|uniref:V-type immunoglobulin domain-containing suppressor of T-cell activation isoform X2 n=1 Tax=Latimeria chalumnae TaxID=7897 RepID=UPI00313D4BBF
MDCRPKLLPFCTGWSAVVLFLCLQVDQVAALKVSPSHSHFICQEGQDVTLTCTLHASGPVYDKHDRIVKFWFFSHTRNHACSEKKMIRNISTHDLHLKKLAEYGLAVGSDHKGTFHVILKNLSQQDNGTYCCYVHEVNATKTERHIKQTVHGYIELDVIAARNDGSHNEHCIAYPSSVGDNEATTAAVLATVGCVIGVLSLPLILLLVYKQRQSASIRRRAHELVRMDSEARGIENPVFDDIPGQTSESRPRILQLGRQQSETGRHLLSEPSTPLSPPVTGGGFFPSLEPLPDSPGMKI